MPKDDFASTPEWQECRQTISRFDGFLADTRKYGFTLVTVLLTANALVTTNPAVDRAAASIVVMALLLALFMLDNYYWILVRAAVKRAEEIESTHHHISGVMGAKARRSHATGLILVVYGLFVFIAAGIAVVAVLAVKPVSVGGLIALATGVVVELSAMFAVFAVVERDTKVSRRFYRSVVRPSEHLYKSLKRARSKRTAGSPAQ
jgi:hypothetical protein